MILSKYKQNLQVLGTGIYSYNTEVGRINHEKKEVHCLGWWSVTTQKHINFVARELGYKLIK